MSDGWVLLGDQGWPASAVTLGRQPSFWSARPIELLTPSGPVGFSVVPKGDLAMYMATVVTAGSGRWWNWHCPSSAADRRGHSR